MPVGTIDPSAGGTWGFMLTDMDPVITMTGVGWAPAGRSILHDVDLAVEAGEMRALVGGTGSGRTAVLRVLVGLIKPDVGGASILGRDCWTDAVALQRQVAFPPALTMWPGLTAWETMAFLHRLSGDGDEGRCRLLMSRFGIEPDTPVGAMASTERHLAGLVAALCRPVEVFLIDDALTGLDPYQAGVVVAAVRDVRREGATVVLTGEPTDGLHRYCDSVTAIEAGRVRAVHSLSA